MKLTQAIDHIRPTIVQICFRGTDFNRPVVCGTGFIVNEDAYVITAGHVIQFDHSIAEQLQVGQLRICVGLAMPNAENIRGNFSIVDANLIEQDAFHDIALLKLVRNPFRNEVRSGFKIGDKEIPLLYGVATLNKTRPKDGAAVGISGYPLGEPVLVTNAGWMATTWSFTTRLGATPILGTKQWFHELDVADCYFADVEVNPGNSGGPVYLIENATVIGVCVGSKLAPVRDSRGNIVNGLFYSSGLTKIVPIRYAIELLQKHNGTWFEL